MKRFLAFLPALFVAVLMVGCTTDIAPGFVGQIKNRSGFSGTILQPGRHTCWGYDQMWKVETRDLTFDTPLSVLLEKDQVNFGVTVSTTVTLKTDDNTIVPLFNKVKPNESNEISLDRVYAVYAKRILNSVPRQLIRPRTIEMILGGVASLENEIEAAVIRELKDTPIRIVGLSLTNLDFPEFITNAQNAAKEREIQIKTAEAQARVEIARLRGVKAQASIEKDIAMIEAQKIADANRLVGESLLGPTGARYLRWHEIKVYGAAAMGPNNAFFLPLNLLSGGYGNNPLISTLVEKPFRDAIDSAIGNTSER